MTRAEALALAEETVSRLAAPTPNARGYADGHKPAPLAERTEAVLAIAAFLAPEEDLDDYQDR